MTTQRITRTAASWLAAAALTTGGIAAAETAPANPQAAGDPKPRPPQGPQDWQGRDQGWQGWQGRPGRQARRELYVAGRVAGLKSVRLRGSNQRNLVALIRTPNGRSQLVDLGPRAGAAELQLQVGDRIRARGTKATVRGRSILVASQASSGDARISIDRSAQRSYFRSRQRAQQCECPRAPR